VWLASWSLVACGDIAPTGKLEHTATSIAALTTWTETRKLTASDGESGGQFGASVSMAGTTAIIGASGPFGGPAAYVFADAEGTWTEQQKLIPYDTNGSTGFGASVAISDSAAFVGADGASLDCDCSNGYCSGTLTPCVAPGAAYVFTRPGLSWGQVAKLFAGDGAAGDELGWSMAAAGNAVVVGAPQAMVSGNRAQGAAYVFADTAAGWSQQQKLTAADGNAGDSFGMSLAMSATTIVVGAPNASLPCLALPCQTLGAAYVFVASTAGWVLQQKLVPAETTGSFGSAVSISNDTVVVGAPAANGGSGAAFAFTRTGTTWSELPALVDPDGTPDAAFGVSVAVSGDTFVVGANFNEYPGTVYVFQRSAAGFLPVQKLLAQAGSNDDSFGTTVALVGDTALVGAPEDSVDGNMEQGDVRVEALLATTGSTCTGGGDCVTGQCVTGICCDDTVCDACSTCATGSCKPIAAGQAGAPACAPYLCNGSSLGCPTGCTTDSECATPDFCAAGRCIAPQANGASCASAGQCQSDICGVAGQCLGGALLGAPCGSAFDCGSDHCVDGSCCDTPCTGQCEACDVAGAPGVCSAVEGSPHGGRAACMGAASPCAGACDGQGRAGCVYPTGACGTRCSSAHETDSLCDGLGACIDGPVRSCNNFACDADASTCKTQCVTSADCDAGFACGADGRCTASASCVGSTSQGIGGARDCAPYGCDTSTGNCKMSCATVADCAAPQVCDPDHHCVALASSGSSGPGGCEATGEDPGAGGPLWIVGASVSAMWARFARRRRDRKESRSSHA
jgi:hypothetical protein